LRLLQALRQSFARDRSERLVLGPAGARDVSARDALDVDHLPPLYQDGATIELGHLAKYRRHLVDVRRDEVIRNDALGAVEPEARELGEDAGLVRDARREHDIE